MAVTKRLRYEVFRRDGFTCRYCGAKPPEAELTTDHVVPVALGGTDEPSNLVTACGPCNSGKTSSSPDAPLVAGVAEDALRWSAAVRQAQAAMVADIKARGADRAQFEAWWDSWGYGEGAERKLTPKDPTWQVTVDQFTAAGLPMLVLKDCIDLAMTRRKIRDENKFRYMCGIAWSKVSEMQKRARSLASTGTVGIDEDDNPEPAAPISPASFWAIWNRRKSKGYLRRLARTGTRQPMMSSRSQQSTSPGRRRAPG